MKVVHRDIDKYSAGHITLIAENEEDMWLTYNLVQVGDKLRCSTVRKVQNESATGSVQTKQVRTNLTIEVEKIDYDLQGSVLHLKGRNVVENQFVKMGAYHTLDLSTDEKFTITKNEWDSVAIMLVEQAADPTQHADLAAVMMHEGLAFVCLVTSTTTIVRAKIETNIPRKRPGLPTSQHEKGMVRFFDQIMQALERHIRFDIVKCIILASPGFVREQFFDYLIQTAVKQDKRVFLENKSKFVLVHSSSGHKHALKEVLADTNILSKLANTKAATEVTALNDFYQMLKVDQSRAFYGYKHVKTAADAFAIDTLLVSDALFRSRDLEERRRYVALVDSVKEDQGTVRIFSSLHVSGEQLNQLSGVAAILRFPIPEPTSESDSDSSANEGDGTR
ncbi:Pelota mRNA surveillance and ribosome rescue factor [Paragonimus heterotremus]|uniref:Protein pelota homolog n=1 Tax=Paragonimus heterotremus TaxID=100268 RepID=A0A8J4T4D5_9TREM|nr:Pelota mRNA surveillance and ribosome rescue factor [Paragonimus heterotremus]